MTIRIAEELRGSWSTFWATTFTFDVSTFEDFVLPRIAGGPLAATVLGDANRLGKEWDRVSGRGHAVRANRDYFVRGIDIGGSFHAKTILLATSERARLLVGSGNLTLAGLGAGEVFTRFESGTSQGDEALAAWRAWMQGVVDRSQDLDLRRRWVNAAGGCPTLEQCPRVRPSCRTRGSRFWTRFSDAFPRARLMSYIWPLRSGMKTVPLSPHCRSASGRSESFSTSTMKRA